MVGIQDEVIHIGHLTIKTHARLYVSHLLHTAHILTLCNHDREGILSERIGCNMEFSFFYLRQLALKHDGKHLLLACFQLLVFCVFFHDEFIYHITVYACEAAFFKLLFQHAHYGYIQLSVHQQDIIPFGFSCFDVAVLFIFIVGIKIDKCTIFICLRIFDESFVFIKGVIFLIGILQQGEIFGTVVKIFLCQHAVIDEYL